MSRLPLRTIEDAPAEARPRLETALQNNGFLPNLVRLLANAPVALETYQTVSGINGRAALNLAEREAVQITAAATHGCGFCVAGHTAIAEKKAKLVLWDSRLPRQKGAAAQHRKLRGSGGGGVVRSLVLQDRGRV